MKPTIEKREYMCLAEFQTNLESGGKSLEFNARKKTTSFTIDRYAMDSNGYHVGYETYQATFETVKKDYRNPLQYKVNPLSGYLVRIDSFDVKLTGSPEAYTCEDCGDDSGEGYFPPDESEAYDLMSYEIEETIKGMDHSWSFNSDNRSWEIA